MSQTAPATQKSHTPVWFRRLLQNRSDLFLGQSDNPSNLIWSQTEGG
jgi:hypothetical protein